MAAEAATGARAGPGPGDGADVGEAPARLLDGEAFFVHFFGRLTERGGNAIPTEPLLPRRTRPIVEGGGEDGDGPDARILEEVSVYRPAARNTCVTWWEFFFMFCPKSVMPWGIQQCGFFTGN